MTSTFRGWTDAAFDFYRGLEASNTKAYWTEHREIYDTEVKAPFDALDAIVADEFGPLKLFRPNRDVRFSKDKSPYKTHAGAATEGEGGEGYYVAVSATGMTVGSGYWMMAKDQLVRFRDAVDDDRYGPELESVVASLRKQKLTIEGHGLKTAPRGYPRDHPRIELLRFKSLAAMREFEPAAWMGTKGAAKRITDVWRAAAPMHRWLATHVGPSTEPPVEGW